MIRHTVTFRLKHAAGSQAEVSFLQAARGLGEIPGVRNFERMRQIGTKNEYDFGFSMIFDSMEAYEAYSAHPDHVAFVQTRWIPEVSDFLEIDYVPYDGA